MAAVPIYFILSGYLFFLKPFSMKRLRHQLLRILKLYLAWKVIYVPVTVFRNIRDSVSIFEGVCTYIYDFVFSDSYLWYLPALMFALVLVSVIRNMKMRYAVALSIGLFIVGLLLDTYQFLVPQFAWAIEIYSKVFRTARNGLFFGTIYVYLGYVFSQLNFRIKRPQAALGTLISLFLLCVEGILLFERRGVYMTNLTVFALPVSVFIFLFAQQKEIRIKEEKLLFIRKTSTALYCVHPVFIVGCWFVHKYIGAISMTCTLMLLMFSSTAASVIIVKLSEKYKLISYLV